ncbi:MAG: GNAT family N-acetyltransferase [Melioribacter sp.]|uniref:GNAT family N-acetyltransferase n=1 Tax=Rosettibacter primus TaxID=3111523 RepID=UPI00247C6688|nr:GNAT family N-acetyltransferase [Melioribacter sp.]
MAEIELIKPEKKHKEIIVDFIKEHQENNEFEIHGGALVEKLEYSTWLKQIVDNSKKETVNKNWVVSSTFLAIRKEDKRLIGFVDIRHELNDFLRLYGGNIGFGVRPEERGKGYGTKILMKALDYCREIGLKKVMLACYKDNIASSKTIKNCGGVLEKEFSLSDLKNFTFESEKSKNKTVQVYWIML